jgi:SAM-dependent methyltransferase
MSSQEFTAGAEKYDRWMGRYTRSLAPLLVEAAGVEPGMRVLDVGCGPGGLTGQLCKLVGEDHVAAIDPAPQFAAACGERHRDADVRVGVAEDLPWPDDSFDAVLASLVIAFMQDPDAGVREMMRVTSPGGVVAACMWDLAGGGMTMLNMYWDAARELDPGIEGERGLPGVEQGDLGTRFGITTPAAVRSSSTGSSPCGVTVHVPGAGLCTRIDASWLPSSVSPLVGPAVFCCCSAVGVV